MPKLDLTAATPTNRTGYPPPYDAAVSGRWQTKIAPLCGLTMLGAGHVRLEPGAWSSQRHWHDDEDELVIMLTGQAVLIEGPIGAEPTRTVLIAGDICGWAANDGIAHHIVNEGSQPCNFVAVSAGNKDGNGGYADIDMLFRGDEYLHKDGTPYRT